MVTTRYWWDSFKLGCLSFGGPAGQIALMHRVAVTEGRHISEEQFQAALSFCMFLPGPEALQLAIFIGWQRLGWKGAVVSGLGFLIPGTAMMLLLAALFVKFGSLSPILPVLTGLKVAAVALLVDALWRLGERQYGQSLIQRAQSNDFHRWRTIVSRWSGIVIALLAMISLSYSWLPYPWIVAGAAVLGSLNPVMISSNAQPVNPRWLDVLKPLLWGVCLWVAVSAAVYIVSGNSLLWRIHVFFSQVALGGFGGAYAVVAWVRDSLSQTGAHLLDSDWLTGLALTETTPGPLTLVLPFYGFLAIFRETASIEFSLLAAVLFVFSVFLPSFVLVIGFSRLMSVVTQNARAHAALRAISSAVLGVIAVFAYKLAVLVCWSETSHSIQWVSVVGVLLAVGLMRLMKWSIAQVIVISLAIPLVGYWL